MNKVRRLQEIKGNKRSKYDEIIEYLNQDNGYWLNNDKWNITKDFFIGKKVKGMKYLNFTVIDNIY
ncbi:hypothetical protein KWY43_19515, partial [Clostridioides difficile]|nr:hypothetical protein [Clostridioides difficile]